MPTRNCLAAVRLSGLLLFPLALTLPLPNVHGASASLLPGTNLNLRLAAPIKTWDEAVPLGNGAMGVLLWGETNLLRLSLDRGDLWDERPSKAFLKVKARFTWASMQRMVTENKMAEFNEVFDSNYDYDGPPSKLPAGRIEILLNPVQSVQSFELNLATAEGFAHLNSNATIRAFVNAASVSRPVALVQIPGPVVHAIRLKAPESVKKLGYPPAQQGESDGLRWFRQEGVDGFEYAVCVGWKREDDATLFAATVATSREGKSPLAVAQARVKTALKAGYDKPLRAHADWWKKFWSQSSVTVPEPHILQHYYLVRYFYGAASRRNAPPMPLQGVWSADAGTLPPWKGDYHNDLNTQMTYMGYQAAGHFDEGACFLDVLWDMLPTFRKFSRDFYDAPGAAVPGVMSLAGQPLGGWGQYSLSPTMGAWNAHLFYLHWRYTGDDRFLRTRAYPWCREIGECLLHLLKPDANGLLKLPLSSSPEIFDNSRRAFLIPNSNYDLMSLKMLFLSLAEMASACGEAKASVSWANAAKQLGPFHSVADGTLLLDEKTPLPGSHRHLSNLMGLYPFNLITADGGERDRRIIDSSLNQWDKSGTAAWCGYSFSWMSTLRARVGDAESALRNLDIYARAFILRNGFHANGDQTKSGFSSMTYRPFTLEGNFLAVAAVHEMLLQSWSAHPGSGDWGVIRLFPATPWRWHDASFDDLRTEGGHRVSARRENNATTWFRLVAGRTGLLRIRDNFGGREPKWSRPGVQKVGDNFEIALKSGQVLEATMAKPATLPPAPPNVAEPLLIQKPAAIRANTLPLRIGADSDGGNRFIGEMARVSVFNRVLTAEEIKRLADQQELDAAGALGALVMQSSPAPSNFRPSAKTVGQVASAKDVDGLSGGVLRFDGQGFLEIPHDKLLDCLDGVTLSAWIRPRQLPPSGARIIDKSPVGAATAYLLDTYPGNSLRLITRDPHLSFAAKLPLNQWSHVAATVDGKTGQQLLYLNGELVARSE
ncbi:MAG: glycoside hydrolase N-terminal domain-containing protein [Verrucomicrobia bacterium]|nr:glycoside hydrolase N-terminal domain-containing protein [Verrucomicrobiota bacterium]